MSFIGDLMETPVEIANDLFNKGMLPLIVLGMIVALIWFVFFK